MVDTLGKNSNRAAAARVGSKSSLKGPSRHSASGAGAGRPVPADQRGESDTLDLARQDVGQFPLRPYSSRQNVCRGEGRPMPPGPHGDAR